MKISGDVTIGNTTSGDTIDGVIAALNTSDISIGGGKTYFGKDGSGWLASHAIEWTSGGTVTIRGVLDVTEGSIGGFTINSTSIYSNISNYLMFNSHTGEVSMAGGAFAIDTDKNITIKGQLQALRGLAIGVSVMQGDYYYGGVLGSWDTFVFVNWNVTSGIEGDLMMCASHYLVNSRVVIILNYANDKRAFYIVPQSSQKIVWCGKTYTLAGSSKIKLNLYEAAMLVFNSDNETWYMTKITG